MASRLAASSGNRSLIATFSSFTWRQVGIQRDDRNCRTGHCKTGHSGTGNCRTGDWLTFEYLAQRFCSTAPASIEVLLTQPAVAQLLYLQATSNSAADSDRSVFRRKLFRGYITSYSRCLCRSVTPRSRRVRVDVTQDAGTLLQNIRKSPRARASVCTN